jgi:hypothetical protein
MVQVTQQAAGRLVRLRDQRGFDRSFGARFVRGNNGVTLTFAATPQPGDQAVEGGDLPISIFLAPDVVPALIGSTIDVKDRDGKEALVLTAPRAAN